MSLLRALVIFACLATCFLLQDAESQIVDGKAVVEATLLPSTTAIVPGRPFEVGLVLEMAPGWHTYWEYSGDAGLPTKIAWSLPEGFQAGPIQWPAPHLMIEPGDIWTYGYGEKTVLFVTIIPPTDLLVGTTVELRGKASWLVCHEMCVPGSAELSLDLPVATSAAAANEVILGPFRAQIPSANPPPFPVDWKKFVGGWEVAVSGTPAGSKVEIFPLSVDDITPGHAVPSDDGMLRITQDGGFRGVLAVEDSGGRRAWYVESGSAQASPPATGLWLALFYGFLGGMILNLMPCVLPVISLKVFGFIRRPERPRPKFFCTGSRLSGGFLRGSSGWRR